MFYGHRTCIANSPLGLPNNHRNQAHDREWYKFYKFGKHVKINIQNERSFRKYCILQTTVKVIFKVSRKPEIRVCIVIYNTKRRFSKKLIFVVF